VTNDAGREIAEVLGLLVRRTTRTHLYGQLTEGIDGALDELTYPVLSGLARTGPCSAANLAREVGLDRSNVTRRADRLERAGFLRREPDPADRRATLLALTDEGQLAVGVTRNRLVARVQDSLASWAPTDVESFARQLRWFVEEGPLAAGS
jgi:DNA-binding MarR family transcriptional regulator